MHCDKLLPQIPANMFWIKVEQMGENNDANRTASGSSCTLLPLSSVNIFLKLVMRCHNANDTL